MPRWKVALFVEDDLLRAGLSKLLAESGFQTVHSFRRPLLQTSRPDVDLVVSDVVFDERLQIDIVAQLKGVYSRAKVAIVTRHLDARLFMEALLAGADGFFRPELDSRSLVSGLVSILTLDAVIVGPLSVRLLRSQFPHLPSLMPIQERPELSGEEILLIRTLQGGLSAKEIARELSISERSVRRRTDKLLERLGARGDFEAGVLVAKFGFV